MKPINSCIGKRDGISGCRDCCKANYNVNTNKYTKCVRSCMKYV